MSTASKTSYDPASAPARIGGGPTRSVTRAAWTALGALILRDVTVLRKDWALFVLRTIIQPVLLCFVFLYVFPKIGQGIGGGSGRGGQSDFATVLVPGVVGISIMFQGVQSIALSMAQEFGYTREIEDRVQAPCRICRSRSPKFSPALCRASSPPSSCCRSHRSCTPAASKPTCICTGPSS